MIYRCILPTWAQQDYPNKPKVFEGEFDAERVEKLNGEEFYHVYFLPNYPSQYDSSRIVVGGDIDTFQYVFVDMDLKEGKYPNKEVFIDLLRATLKPTIINDSGNGIHAYWRVTDLDAMTFLKLQRRMMRKLNTDEAVCKIMQLMRAPNTLNIKDPENPKLCTTLENAGVVYSPEDLDKILPPLSKNDESFCTTHYDMTYKTNTSDLVIDDTLPQKFYSLIRNNLEVERIWRGEVADRSGSDFRLANLMHEHGFTKNEAFSVLLNAAKALERTPVHRIGYAEGIVNKVWTFEEADEKDTLELSSSVKDILSRDPDKTEVGTPLPCWSYIDATETGFRLGQVIGLVAGSGVGKTAIALNMFMGFVKNNPDCDHFFIPLEQPAREIAMRWKTMCGDNTKLYEKVHVIDNYDPKGQYRNLSLDEIQDYLLKYQRVTGRKVGCVVIDHIGALKKKTKDGESQGLMDICHRMKAFAIATKTLLIMQSQAPREKAGIGDIELDKDAAYGTMYFEAYCDYLITMWQPLKRCYSNKACPTVTAFKFCKIRHKKQGLDRITEDTRYLLYFDPIQELLSEMTETQFKSFDFFNKQAVSKRKEDKKTDVVPYISTLTLREGVSSNVKV